MPTPNELEIHSFLTDMFGENEGVLYAPTKGESAKSFVRYYFNWPSQKEEVVQHMLQANQNKKDVWVAPALLKSSANAKKTNWLGTQHLYVDFDNGIPKSLPDGVPEPTLKIQSSTPDRQHWYWKLDKFYTGDDNRDMLEGLNKSLAYMLGADTGGWDATQVLRCPGTKHRSKGLITRVLKRESDSVYNVGTFKNVLPAPAKEVVLKQQEKSLPSIEQVLSNPKVRLTQDAYEIFNRSRDEVPDRSVALFRFAAECLEVQPPIFKSDILALLNHLAIKWGKFEDRSDRFERVKSVLKNAIQKHDPKKQDTPEDAYDAEAFRSFTELTEYIISNPANWIIEGLLPERQTMQIVGEANIGKTSLAFRLCADIITGRDFLLWKHGATETKHSVAYVGLDMDEGDAHDLLQSLMLTLSPDEARRFNEAFRVSSPDYGIELYDTKVQERYEELFSALGSTIVVFDSLKDTGALDGDDKRKSIFQWFKRRLMREMGLTVIVLTHTRKKDKDSKVHQTQDDVYGSGMQNADIKASLLMYRTSQSSSIININQTKVRRAKKLPVFSIKRVDDKLEYEIIEENVDTSEPANTMLDRYKQSTGDNILFGAGADSAKTKEAEASTGD